MGWTQALGGAVLGAGLSHPHARSGVGVGLGGGDGGPGPHTRLPGGPGGLGHASDVSHIPEGSRHPLLVGLDWGLPGGRFGLAMVTCLARPPGLRPKPNALPEFGESGAPLFLASTCTRWTPRFPSWPRSDGDPAAAASTAAVPPPLLPVGLAPSPELPLVVPGGAWGAWRRHNARLHRPAGQPVEFTATSPFHHMFLFS